MPAAEAIQTPAPAGVDSVLLEVSAAGLFETIGHSDLAERGLALVVSIAPIRTALGPRWSARRAQIHEIVERYFRKSLAPDDIWQPVTEVLFLVATPGKSPMHAQAVCYRALKEVLTHFLGNVQPADLEVCRITHLSAGSIEMRAHSMAELVQADLQAPTPGGTGAPATSTPASPITSQIASWPLRTADGRDLRASFVVEPMMSLKALKMAGHRIESRIVDRATGVELNGLERRRLLPRDFEKVDLAALERGMSRLTSGEIPNRPSLIIQLSFASLSNGRARASLLDQARAMQGVLRQAAICELVDVESGVPVGRLEEVASLIQGFFCSLWVQVEPNRIAIGTAVAARVSGITFKAVDLGDTAAAMAKTMPDAAQIVRERNPNMPLAVGSLPGANLMIDALAAGFNYASLRAER